jgi:hypothetical protein
MQQEHKQTRLTRLIRTIAKEVAYEIMYEHLEEYEHKPKKADDFEAQLCEGEST